MRRLPNGGGVGAGNDERRGTMAGRGGRAVPRGQARGQAQGQAVAAGTSSRLSFLMLCGRNYTYVCADRFPRFRLASVLLGLGTFACARGSRCCLFLVVARVEGVLDDAPDQLRREAAGQLRGKNRGERVEAVALVGAEAARRRARRRRTSQHFSQWNPPVALCGVDLLSMVRLSISVPRSRRCPPTRASPSRSCGSGT